MFPRFLATERYDVVEVQVPASSKSIIPITDQPQLRSDQTQDIIIQAIETFCVFDMPVTPTNNPLCTDVQMINAFLTLYVNGEESLYRIGLQQLHRIANAVNATPANIPYNWDLFKLDNVQIDWQKCHVDYPAGFGANTAFSFLFGIHYKKLPPGTMARIQQIQQANYCNIKAS
jgi:hypothetical protein